ncbi:3746_t:CDS:2 [Paraglomus occultum]|uniref:Dolichyl-diphosphooligosaccharide--protein glycosyltransferase subunit WBP1 n=1 Tax=Paraglomus occultum TaxID=144539 RepID=A0A9N8WN53_9GLOM|nr:3746_t:CDS:2 [Paraglomus occultum]
MSGKSQTPKRPEFIYSNFQAAIHSLTPTEPARVSLLDEAQDDTLVHNLRSSISESDILASDLEALVKDLEEDDRREEEIEHGMEKTMEERRGLRRRSRIRGLNIRTKSLHGWIALVNVVWGALTCGMNVFHVVLGTMFLLYHESNGQPDDGLSRNIHRLKCCVITALIIECLFRVVFVVRCLWTYTFKTTIRHIGGIILGRSTTGNRVLVLLDSIEEKPLYGIFFGNLEARGYTLTYSIPSTPFLDLFHNSLRSYDHVIIFSPKTKTYPSTLSPTALVSFINAGGNILLAASSDVSETWRDFAREFDIEFDEKDTMVIDHFNYDESDNGNHTLIVVDKEDITDNNVVIGKEVKEGTPLLYKGIGHKAGSSPMLVKIAWAGDTAYSYDLGMKMQADDGEQLLYGRAVGLVTAMQARNSARVTFVGSLDMFRDELINASVKKRDSPSSYAKSGNEAFLRELTKWTFQEKGILRVISREIHKEGEHEQQHTYRIKDDVQYSIEISEYSDNWQAFNATDVQLEIIMLDPYIRTTLDPLPTLPTQNSRKFGAQLKLPDVYGVFTFKVNYKRPGYTYIEDRTTIAIRPFRHNEYPRFLSAAYPYYVSAVSMIIGWFVFVIVWLFNQDKERLEKVVQKKVR